MNRGDIWMIDLGGKIGMRPFVILTRQNVLPFLNKEDDAWRIVSARKAVRKEKIRYEKKMTPIEERETTTISLQIPCDIMDDLKSVSEARGITNLESLIKYYVGQGLRKDIGELRRKNSAEYAKKIMGKYNIDPKIINEVIAAVSQ